MLEIDILEPDEVDRAKQILLRDGFVAVRNVLVGAQLERIQKAANCVIKEIVDKDPKRIGNRGHHRYSFGNQIHHFEWCELVDLPPILAIVEAIWNSGNFVCNGAGGDLSLPTAEIHPLHSDGNELGFTDPWIDQISYRSLPPPTLVVNFPMVDFTKDNGAIRQIPCTQRSQAQIPTLEEEPPWMKSCLICVPTGAALIRDVRCWHGGTANNSTQPRPMTSVQYYAPWFRQHLSSHLPRRHYDQMSARAQQLCRYIVMED